MRGDGLYKRPGSPFRYFKLKSTNGRWREISTREKNYLEAKRKRRRAIQDQEDGKWPDGELARLPFGVVVDRYLEIAATRLRPSSRRKEAFFLVRPTRLFGSLACEKITGLNVQQLQASMKEDGCHNSYINLVVSAAARVLRLAKTWRRIQDDVHRLRERVPPPRRVLAPEQKVMLFKVAATNPEWTVAYAAGLIAANTTMRGCDLRGLQRSDVDLGERIVGIPDSKTEAGVRRIPLNNDAFLGFLILFDRLEKLGVTDRNSYVFPACEHGHIDPTKPQTTWRTAWRSLTKAAGLKGVRFHDLRHQCITELAEKGQPEGAILSIAGHVSRRMLEHYSHIRLEAKRKALDSLTPIASRDVLRQAI
jgi:integrase